VLVAAMPGPVRPLYRCDAASAPLPIERLLVEHSTATNTAAAGGNATLMTLEP
jgi:RHH-type transcriptional regulator, proline utilization regulon repressor / proline dehydrogenase / delta 1-pyrroline-5-carboxylate dehydrogenase